MTLKDDIKSDLDTFFDPDEFAVLAIWKRDGHGDKEVYGHLDEDIQQDQIGPMDTSIERETALFTCNPEHVLGMKKDETLIVGADSFSIRNEVRGTIYLEKK